MVNNRPSTDCKASRAPASRQKRGAPQEAPLRLWGAGTGTGRGHKPRPLRSPSPSPSPAPSGRCWPGLFAQPPPAGAGSRLPGAGGAAFPAGICRVRGCAARRAPRLAPRVIYCLAPRRQRCGSGAAASNPRRRRGTRRGVPEKRRGRFCMRVSPPQPRSPSRCPRSRSWRLAVPRGLVPPGAFGGRWGWKKGGGRLLWGLVD